MTRTQTRPALLRNRGRGRHPAIRRTRIRDMTRQPAPHPRQLREAIQRKGPPPHPVRQHRVPTTMSHPWINQSQAHPVGQEMNR